jgi:hypothetical protein
MELDPVELILALFLAAGSVVFWFSVVAHAVLSYVPPQQTHEPPHTK